MDTIYVLDLGCQYTHQIATNVRKAGVYSEIVPCDISFKELKGKNPIGIILSGSPDNVGEKGSRRCDKRILNGDLGVPGLGICYGHQLMAHELGGNVGKGEQGEYGPGEIDILNESPLFAGLDKHQYVWMSHGDSVLDLPPGFEPLAVSSNNLLAAMGDEERNLYGLQFHPEVSNTPNGKRILSNFAKDICGADPGWKMGNYADAAMEEIRRIVGDGTVYVYASGGVDSTVAAMLAYNALGKDRVKLIHIDNGFERKNEAKKVEEMLIPLGMNLQVLDKSDYFLKKVGQTVDPEKKRNLIGDAFVDVLDESDFADDENAYLIQGTIYPDIIESKGGIKGHHNVNSELIKELKRQGRVIEPNRDLFKDEVREIGELLGLNPETYKRHPFPGPGFGVRYVGRIIKPKNYDGICSSFSGILSEYDLEGVVAPIGVVGVKGSARGYGNIGMVYGEKKDVKNAANIALRAGNEIPGIMGAAFVLDGERYGQNEWNTVRRMPITRERLEILRTADDIAMTNLVDAGLYNTIAQMPVAIFPGPRKTPWVGLRPVITDNFMTVRVPEIPEELGWDYFEKTIRDINNEIDIGGIFVDLTPKPPRTVEFE